MNSNVKSRKLDKVLRDFILDRSCEQSNAIIDRVKNNIDNNKKSVALCFRGDYMCLYYRCHMLLLIEYKKQSKKIVGEFNFRHSRFTKDYAEKEKRLRDLHVDNFNKDKYVDENGEEKTYSFDSTKIRFDIVKPQFDGEKYTFEGLISRNELEEILDIYMGLIEDFVDTKVPHNVYYWQGKKDKPKVGDIANKSRNTEKDAQQMLYAKYFYCPDKFIYDLEYTEHGISKKEAELLTPEELAAKSVHGRFDLLGLVHEKNGDVLEFIELKSTLSACTKETSGVRSHIKDYMTYLENDERVKARMEEALDTIKILREIFGVKFIPQPLKNLVRARVRFVFTDDAEKYDFPIAVTKFSQV